MCDADRSGRLQSGQETPNVVEVFSNSASRWFVALVIDATDGVLTVRFLDGDNEKKEKSAYSDDPLIARFGTHTGAHPPPGVVPVPSTSRPGELSFLDTTLQRKFASPELAWQAYLELHLFGDVACEVATPIASRRQSKGAPASPSSYGHVLPGSPSSHGVSDSPHLSAASYSPLAEQTPVLISVGPSSTGAAECVAYVAECQGHDIASHNSFGPAFSPTEGGGGGHEIGNGSGLNVDDVLRRANASSSDVEELLRRADEAILSANEPPKYPSAAPKRRHSGDLHPPVLEPVAEEPGSLVVDCIKYSANDNESAITAATGQTDSNCGEAPSPKFTSFSADDVEQQEPEEWDPALVQSCVLHRNDGCQLAPPEPKELPRSPVTMDEARRISTRIHSEPLPQALNAPQEAETAQVASGWSEVSTPTRACADQFPSHVGPQAEGPRLGFQTGAAALERCSVAVPSEDGQLVRHVALPAVSSGSTPQAVGSSRMASSAPEGPAVVAAPAGSSSKKVMALQALPPGVSQVAAVAAPLANVNAGVTSSRPDGALVRQRSPVALTVRDPDKLANQGSAGPRRVAIAASVAQPSVAMPAVDAAVTPAPPLERQAQMAGAPASKPTSVAVPAAAAMPTRLDGSVAHGGFGNRATSAETTALAAAAAPAARIASVQPVRGAACVGNGAVPAGAMIRRSSPPLFHRHPASGPAVGPGHVSDPMLNHVAPVRGPAPSANMMQARSGQAIRRVASPVASLPGRRPVLNKHSVDASPGERASVTMPPARGHDVVLSFPDAEELLEEAAPEPISHGMANHPVCHPQGCPRAPASSLRRGSPDSNGGAFRKVELPSFGASGPAERSACMNREAAFKGGPQQAYLHSLGVDAVPAGAFERVEELEKMRAAEWQCQYAEPGGIARTQPYVNPARNTRAPPSSQQPNGLSGRGCGNGRGVPDFSHGGQAPHPAQSGPMVAPSNIDHSGPERLMTGPPKPKSRT